MTRKTIRPLAAALLAAAALYGCGSESGSQSGEKGAPTLRIGIADAKPALPEGVQEVWINVSEVRVHSADGDWVTLPLATPDYKVDLLQWQDGKSTQLVPPTELYAGKYTQLRFEIESASMKVGGVEQDLPLDVPSGGLKTDQNFELTAYGAVNLTVDFDLSRSIVATGGGTYKLKPVLHVVETSAAATVSGSLAPATFEGQPQATVVIYVDEDGNGAVSDGEPEYTRIVVPAGAEAAPFTVYWLVPGEAYVVQVRVERDGVPPLVYEESFLAADVAPGVELVLNDGQPI